ncbi:MAG TPA: YggS family pyridoxal phosphate enzyme [Acidimicrobiales bacterium]|nr:YggS family pyridoxal phosphate enzyme [Acidimicrobiales bacterium]
MAAALDAVRRRIASATDRPDRVRVVAVTKGHGAEAVRSAVAAGLPDIGENYAQELLAKAAQLPSGCAPRWHFLGAVQRNKVADLAPLVAVWQSVDRVEEARRIASLRPGAEILVEVALFSGPGRGGVSPRATAGLVEEARSLGLAVGGLMAVGPPGPPEEARPGFRWLAGEARRLGLGEVSMGMTADLEVAVEEGSTMVRVGTALFGPRPGAPELGR